MRTQASNEARPQAVDDPALEARVAQVCAQHGNAPGALIEILHDLQSEAGYVPDSALPIVANALNLSRAEVYGVRTFYHDFRSEPAGRHVLKVCQAEACQAMGAEKLAASLAKSLGVDIGCTSSDGAVTLKAVYCLGNCALSPAVMLDGKLIGRANERSLLAQIGAGKSRARNVRQG